MFTVVDIIYICREREAGQKPIYYTEYFYKLDHLCRWDAGIGGTNPGRVPVNTRYCTNAGLMLDRRLRRRPSIKQALDLGVALAGRLDPDCGC